MVTILGGVLVYHYTDLLRDRGPEFTLSHKEISVPGTDLVAFLVNAEVENVGRGPARDVELFIEHGMARSSIERDLKLRSGPEQIAAVESHGIIKVQLDKMLPGDGLSAT